MDGQAQLSFPPLAPWLRNLLVVLFGAYVVELLARNGGVDVYALAWQPFGQGFQAWQPLTRFLVQGPSVFAVLFGLLTLYFLLPALLERLAMEQVRNALLAAALGSSVLILLLDLVFADQGMAVGWTGPVIVSMLALFGLAAPEATIYLMFLIPVSARFLMYVTGVFSVLFLLMGPSHLQSADSAGAFGGVLAWWYGLGPGARRRHLKEKARAIEEELRRFEVIEGGKAQRDQAGRDDEWIH